MPDGDGDASQCSHSDTVAEREHGGPFQTDLRPGRTAAFMTICKGFIVHEGSLPDGQPHFSGPQWGLKLK